jgi:hypothetical protein
MAKCSKSGICPPPPRIFEGKKSKLKKEKYNKF